MANHWNLSDPTIAEYWQRRREDEGLALLTPGQLAAACAMCAACTEGNRRLPHPWTAMMWASSLPAAGVDASGDVWRLFVENPPKENPAKLIEALITAIDGVQI